MKFFENKNQNERDEVDEVDDLLISWKKESAEPNIAFKQQLQARALKRFNRFNLKFLFQMNKFKYLALFSLFAFVALGTFTLYSNQIPTESNSGMEIEDKHILANIALANPEPMMNISQMRDIYTRSADAKKYNYTYSESKYIAGPAKRSFCDYGIGVIDVKLPSSITDSISKDYMYIKDGKLYSKTITTTTDGKLKDYYLTTPEKTVSYQGGKYAIVEYRKLDDNYGVPDFENSIEDDKYKGLTDEEIVNKRFGSDAKATIVEMNGKKYYRVVTTSHEICPNEGSNVDDLIFYVSYFDMNTLQQEIAEDYLNSESPENLISHSEFSAKYENKSFDEVKSVFEFEYDVEIKDISEPARTEGSIEQDEKFREDNHKKAIEEYLKLNNTVIFESIGRSDVKIDLFTGSEIEKIAINLNSPRWLNYHLDREYYPAGELGDQIYNEQVRLFAPGVTPQVEFQLSGKNTNLYARVFKNESDVDEFKKSESLPTTTAVSSKSLTKIRIDGNEINADLSTILVNDVGEYYSYKIYFKYNGYGYAVDFTDYTQSNGKLSEQEIQKLFTLKTFDTTKAEDLEKILKIV